LRSPGPSAPSPDLRTRVRLRRDEAEEDGLRNKIGCLETASWAAIIVDAVVALGPAVFGTKASSGAARIALLTAATVSGLGTLLIPRDQIQLVDNGIGALN
jgi:hypothetical protein